MTEEIKEILDGLNQITTENKKSKNPLICTLISFAVLYKLLDYITNLQEDNVELRNEVKELERMCELYGKSIYNAELTNLQEENEHLEKVANERMSTILDIEKYCIEEKEDLISGGEVCEDILKIINKLKER